MHINNTENDFGGELGYANIKLSELYMKRALIITFFDEINYGAVLQSYAMLTKLQEYYREVNIINYQPAVMKAKRKLLRLDSLKAFVLSIILFPQNAKRQRVFSRFITKHLSVKDLSILQNDDTRYENDVFLGSDQIWNPRITGGADPVFFGIIPTLTRRKTIAYAPSFGVNNLTENELKEISLFLSQVDNLSVREQEAKNLISSTSEKEVQVVCDPTLLLKANEWEGFVRKPIVKKDYVFIYSLSQDTEVLNVATKLAQSLHIPVIEGYLGRKPKGTSSNHRVLFALSPEEFLGYIYNSRFVVTDSFHGTVFSIIFHKTFYSVPFKGKEGRVKDLLTRCGLSNRIVSSGDDLNLDELIDYNHVDKALSLFREQSIKYIEECIL